MFCYLFDNLMHITHIVEASLYCKKIVHRLKLGLSKCGNLNTLKLC